MRSRRESVKPLTDFLTAKNLAEEGIAGVFTNTTAFAPPSGMSLWVEDRREERNYLKAVMMINDIDDAGFIYKAKKRKKKNRATAAAESKTINKR